MFTIEIDKIDGNKEFGLEDLKMFHKECLGGNIHFYPVSGDRIMTTFHCYRCGSKREFKDPVPENAKIEMIRIAIVGGEIKIGDDVHIIQKN